MNNMASMMEKLASAGEDAEKRNQILLEVVAELSTKLEVMENQFSSNVPVSPSTHSREPVPLSQLRGLESVGTYSGNYIEFEVFFTRLTSFLADVPGVREFMKWAETKTEDVTDAEVEKYTNLDLKTKSWVVSQQLHTLLIQRTSGVPWDVVNNSAGNGMLAWQRLVRDGGLVTAQIRRKILANVIQPVQVSKYEEVLAAEEAWLRTLKKYNDNAKEKLPEDVLVTSYVALLPQKLADDIDSLEREFEKMSEVQSYVRKQVHSRRTLPALTPRRALNAVEEPNGVEDSVEKILEKLQEEFGVEPTEESQSLVASLVKGKGGKSKGKGKGGCWECGGNHKRSECPVYDEKWKSWRSQPRGGDFMGPGKGNPSSDRTTSWSTSSGKGLPSPSGFPPFKGKGKGKGKQNTFMGAWMASDIDGAPTGPDLSPYQRGTFHLGEKLKTDKPGFEHPNHFAALIGDDCDEETSRNTRSNVIETLSMNAGVKKIALNNANRPSRQGARK